MQDIAEMRARFLAEPLPRQLGALAADLARVASSARRPARAEIVARMLPESIYFIEWSAASVAPEMGAEMHDMQLMLGMWRTIWPQAQRNSTQRVMLYLQAKKWSEQVLDYSGLLAAE